MAQSLKRTIATKLRDALPGHKSNIIFELKTSSAGPELHLNSAQFRPHIGDNAAIWPSIVGDLHANGRITRTGAAIPLDRNQLFGEALANPLGGDVATAVGCDGQTGQTVLVEFSSPNIAKPFHVGHLRSTIIGNFVANILQRSALHHRVHRINYLGDWGTQFGYLAVGMRLRRADGNHNDQQMLADPIRHLFEAYVHANELAKTDPTIAPLARQLFGRLEAASDVDGITGDSAAELAQWTRIREHTVRELRTTYTRLGVAFDEYSWESDYRKQRIGTCLERMAECGALVADDQCAFVACVDGRRVPLIKSDGTTVYLTRDCAALQERAQRHRFDRMLYVVDNGQSDHFRNLFAVGRQMEIAGIGGAEHVKFGRIHGMSTREGRVVFLRDILDEARDRMFDRQRLARTTRIEVGDADDRTTADVLGISAVIVNDLKQRRQRDYEFDWDKALQMNGDTGIRLQYTHCRLCSLAESCRRPDGGETVETRPSVDLLPEPEAQQLLFEMARYTDVLARSEQTLEACVLVVYLFGLCNAINRALAKLNVKDHQSEDVRAQRLLLFGRARETLHDGMVIIGLKPLRRM